jgi:molybdopterin-guanine dinucleotide biosynthesis protein B
MHVIGVAGHSDTGKTTHVEQLIPALCERGRVATVKSIHHAIELDEPGTDTYRHRQAGAERVSGVTPAAAFEINSDGKRRAVDREGVEAGALRSRLLAFAREGVDYAVVEGFTSSLVPVVLTDERAREEVGGPVLGHVDDVGLDAQIERLEELARFDTPEGLAAAAAADASDLAVGTDTFAADRDAEEWTASDGLPGDGDPAVLDTVARELGGRPTVSSVDVVVRPPVTPGDLVAVHVVVGATGRSDAFLAVEGARERLRELWPAFDDATAESVLVR